MTDKLEALSQPVRIYHDWNSATMAHCGKCDQWEMTIADAEGVQTCASCYDAEWLSEWQGYAEVLEQRAVSLLAALEEINRQMISDAVDAEYARLDMKRRAEAAEQREGHLKATVDVLSAKNAELERRNNYLGDGWRPDVDPITGRPFFMWINHPDLGYVPTYGGPYDSFTLAERDSNGEFSVHRYDHDEGAWVDDECVTAQVVEDWLPSSQSELDEHVKEKTAELQQRLQQPIKLPERGATEINEAAWILHNILTMHGPINSRQFNNLERAFYEALKTCFKVEGE